MGEFRRKDQKLFVDKIKQAKIKPNEMSFHQDIDTYGSENFTYKFGDSGLYFRIYPQDDNFDLLNFSFSTYTPGRTVSQFYNRIPLNEALSSFQKWIDEHVLKYEDDSDYPDPWAQFLNNYNESVKLETFTTQEITQIERELDDFPKFLTQRANVAPDKLDLILDEIKELKKDLKTKPKQKWAKQLVLFMVQEVWDAVKDEAVMNQVKGYFLTMLSKVIEYVPHIFKSLS